MNQKERLIRILAGLPVDRPPVICPGGMMSMIVTEVMDAVGSSWPAAHSDPRLMASLTAGANTLAGVENVGVPFCMTVEAEAMGAQVDLGGFENEPRVTAYAIDTLSDLARLAPLDPGTGRAAVCAEAVRILKETAPDVPVIGNLTGPVSLATSLVDPLLYYRALRRDKGAAHRLNRICTDSAIAFGESLVEAGADVICIADPSATGELIGSRAFAEFVLPYLNEMTEHFRVRCAAPSIVHICGDVKSLGGVLGSLAAEVVSVDSVVSIATLRELARGKIAMGNLSTFLLEKGDPAGIARAARACLDQGVDILSPACGIGPRTPVANVRSLGRAALSWRKESP